MSLFGSSPVESSLAAPLRQSQSKSLFDDDAVGPPSNGSLFAEESTGNSASPWSFPTPKKSGRDELVKSLLPASDVPENYIDAFDTLINVRGRSGAGVSGAEVRRVLESTNLPSVEQTRILNLVTGGKDENSSLGRNEFNVLLALVGLAQENEEPTLDGVDERRKTLPEVSIPYVKQLNNSKVSQSLEDATPPASSMGKSSIKQASSSPAKSRLMRKDSLDDPQVDPWASPAVSRNKTSAVNNDATPASNTVTAARPIPNGQRAPSRTTSAFTTNSDRPVSTSSTLPVDSLSAGIPSGAIGGGWGSYDNPSAGFPSGDPTGGGAAGFGSGGDDGGIPEPQPTRTLGRGKINTSRGVEETVTITVLPEKEGMFMFQHRNYEVKSARRASTVIRRYSDFVWLLDCLHKRYPFRQLPLLPPKRVAVNGRHLSSDITFIEKRRRGLARFANALVRHPVLNQEQLVVMFLTVPTEQELAVWRKQATISVQEEFTGKLLPPGLEDSFPTNLADTFDAVRAGVRKSADTYIGLCNLIERVTKRNQGLASDYSRFASALRSLTEETEATYATDTTDVPTLNAGIQSSARHFENSQSLLEDEARAWDENVLEDFKRQRDTLVSIRDMFDRRDRYARDNIPQLVRRIESNENRLATLRAKPEGTVKLGEQEKVEQAILSDKQSIVNQHARGVFIKECVRDELIFFQQSQYHISKLHQDWSQERVKYVELQADNWRQWSEEVENMPLGD